MFRKSYLTLVGIISLLLLAVAPVYAAPSLSLGSNASYNLTVKLQASQNCTAVPANYTLQACYGITPPPPPPPPPTITVLIVDNGICQTNEPSCQFTPAVSNVPQGSTIIWKNNGTLVHAVTSNATANGLPLFSSGNIAPVPKGNFSYTFKFPGTYHYYDPSYTWMRGTINVPFIVVALPVNIQPIPRPTEVDLAGTVGWNVEGLSNDQANLNVSHQIGVSFSPFPGFSITPVTESGSFEQSIDLSTRVESPGTATSIVRSFVTMLLPALLGSTLATGATSQVFQTMFSGQSTSPDFTEWWVNGPLSSGSPVQILHGWSSVTGSETLNLGTTIGTRSAWIVTSQLSQTLNVYIPNPNNLLNTSTSKVAANLKFLWSYDKSADLLLRNSDTLSLTIHSVTPTTIYTSTPCGQYVCSTQVTVTVTRDMALTINLALLLASTTVHLPGSPSQASTLMSLLSALPWMPLGIAGLAAGVGVALIFWLTRRANRTTLPEPAPATTPAPSPTAPS